MPPQASTIMCTWIGRREAANNNTKFYISGEVVANTRLYNLKQFDMYMRRISEAKHVFLITVSNHGASIEGMKRMMPPEEMKYFGGVILIPISRERPNLSSQNCARWSD